MPGMFVTPSGLASSSSAYGLRVTDPPYSARGDGRVVTDAAITTATATLTSATAAFTGADIGKRVNVVGAGAAGALLSTTISGFTNSTTVTLTANAGTTVSGKVCTVGTDDSTAFANALADAHTAGGGRVYVPQVVGTYCVNQLLDVPDDVWLQGGGRTGTRITWMSDLGASSSGLRSGPNSTNPNNTPSGSNYTLITDLEIVGPGDQNSALGTQPAAMRGINLRANGRAKCVNTYGWHSGFAFTGNHESVEDCAAKSNLYGAYWDGSAGSFGDQYIAVSEFVANKRAGYGIHGDNNIDACTFISCHAGFQPYGVYKENTGVPNKEAVTNTMFVDQAFEAHGNAAMFDQNKTGAAGKNWNNITFDGGAAWGRDVTYKIAAEVSDYIWVAHSVFDIVFNPPAGFPAAAAGFLDWNFWTNVEIRDGRTTIAAVTSALPICKAANAAVGDLAIYNSKGAKCRVLKYAGGVGNAAINDLVYFGASIAGVFGASKQATAIAVGVAQTAVNDANWGIFAVQGNATVNVQTTFASPSWIKGDTANRGKIIAGLTSDGRDAIGFAESGTGASTTQAILCLP